MKFFVEIDWTVNAWPLRFAIQIAEKLLMKNHSCLYDGIGSVPFGPLVAFLTHEGQVAHMCLWTSSSLVQVIACCMFKTKSLPEPMMTYCQLDHWKQISMKTWELKYEIFLKKLHLKMSSAKCHPYSSCPSLCVNCLQHSDTTTSWRS